MKTLYCLFAAAMVTAISSQPAIGATYNIKAASAIVILPDGPQVKVWGYSLVSYDLGGGLQTVNGPVLSPGPELSVPPGQGLVINLQNQLPEATSIVIPGQSVVPPGANESFQDSKGRRRFRSLTVDTGVSATRTYTWSSIRPGTYLYQSGSHPAKQVQMGLYGALTADGGPSSLYGQSYDLSKTLVFGEIDRTLHEAVDPVSGGTPTYGGANGPTSTFGYSPQYFFVNGKSYPDTAGLIGSPLTGEKVLFRFLNAGLRTHTAMLNNGGYMSVVAEDGFPYPYEREQYDVFLPAGKTSDAFWTAGSGDFALYDHTFALTVNGKGNGGMLVPFSASPPTPPVAKNDSYAARAGVLLSVSAQTGILANDTYSGTPTIFVTTPNNPTKGTLALNTGDGSFTYTPAGGLGGTDSFKYTVATAGGTSGIANVKITISPNTQTPTANADTAAIANTSPATINVLANDTNPAGNPALTVANLILTQGSGTVAPGPSNSVVFTAAPSFKGVAAFTYQASAGGLLSNVAKVTVNVNPPPTAALDSVNLQRPAIPPPPSPPPPPPSVTIPVLTNDAAAVLLNYSGNSLNPASIVIVTPPKKGTATVANGMITYKLTKTNFVGTDTFAYTVADSLGTVSAKATVQVNVLQ